jgi:hypothetical protein
MIARFKSSSFRAGIWESFRRVNDVPLGIICLRENRSNFLEEAFNAPTKLTEPKTTLSLRHSARIQLRNQKN